MATMKINFLSRCLGRQVDFNAVIPSYTFKRGATETPEQIYDPNRKFKMLILLHGFSGDCNDYISWTNVVRYAEDRKIVVVMPSGFNSGYADGQWGDKMRTFVAKELVQVCRYMLPVSDKREDTYIGGLSMGAAGSAKIALAYPEVFSEVLCMSGAPEDFNAKQKKISLSWFGKDDEVYQANPKRDNKKLIGTKEDAYYQAVRNVKEGKPLPKFFMTIGSNDFLLERARDFQGYLTELGSDVRYEEIPGYGHEWDFWELKVRDALYTFFTIE